MNLWELTAPCHFGTEAVLKREILDLGYEVTRVEDGRVTFEADAQGVADANLFLRTTERVLLKVGEVKAETFDELFEKTKALPWENYIPKNGKFWVAKANSIKSKQITAHHGDQRGKRPQTCQRILRQATRRIRHNGIQLRKRSHRSHIQKTRNNHGKNKHNTNRTCTLPQ